MLSAYIWKGTKKKKKDISTGSLTYQNKFDWQNKRIDVWIIELQNPFYTCTVILTLSWFYLEELLCANKNVWFFFKLRSYHAGSLVQPRGKPHVWI